ncbi:hypothetical protein EU538_09210 [Candidatus Thorarchaeota archaeon]|nr:MAG: hypothetical protein EU538_09210 [Candidatus Thorarchaeota archaeon]
MPKPGEMDRLTGLLDAISLRSRPFLVECSEAKMLAISNIDLALERYWNLTRQALDNVDVSLPEELGSDRYFDIVRQALETGVLSASYVDALEKLRSGFLNVVLRPAVGVYLKKQTEQTSELERLYENALRLDGLLELANFLRRVSKR